MKMEPVLFVRLEHNIKRYCRLNCWTFYGQREREREKIKRVQFTGVTRKNIMEFMI